MELHRDKALVDVGNDNPLCFRELRHCVQKTDIDVALYIELLTIGIKEVDIVDTAAADGEELHRGIVLHLEADNRKGVRVWLTPFRSMC